MKHPAAGGRHRLGPGATVTVLLFTGDAVGIAQHELRFIGGVRLEVENASGKHVGHGDVIDRFADDPFTLQTQQRKACVPAGLPACGRSPPLRITVVVAIDEPLEAEIDERRRIDDELASGGAIAGRPSTTTASRCTLAAFHARSTNATQTMTANLIVQTWRNPSAASLSIIWLDAWK